MPNELRFLCLVFATFINTVSVSRADDPTRHVLLEVYVSQDAQLGTVYIETAQKVASDRGGIQVVVRNLSDAPNNGERLRKIADHYGLAKGVTPVIYGCNRVISEVSDPAELARQIERMLTMEVFVREGCSRCAAAEEILPKLLKSYPGVRLHFRSVNKDPLAINEMNALVKKHKTAAASTPILHLCNTIQVGFDRSPSASDRVRKALERWTFEATVSSQGKGSEVPPTAPFSQR